LVRIYNKKVTKALKGKGLKVWKEAIFAHNV
jgi:hypothetical protein